MANQISCGPIHHLRLTVTDVKRSREFYTQVLGFAIAVDAPPPADHAEHGRISEALQGGIVLINGTMLMGLRPAAPAGDRFDENRVGLDHLSFNAGARADLDRALNVLDEWGVPHGEIRDLGPGFGLYILEVTVQADAKISGAGWFAHAARSADVRKAYRLRPC